MKVCEIVYFSLYLILSLPNSLADMELMEEVCEYIKMHTVYCNLVSKWK